MDSTAASVALAALYLRGGPSSTALPRRRWMLVDGALRRADSSLESAAADLAREGLWPESIVLEQPGLLSWAEQLYLSGQVLTPYDASYPARWRMLGQTAPPALWRSGNLPSRSLLAVVGSRAIASSVAGFARDVGGEAVRLGFGVVSGGAAGCDSAAAEGALGYALEVLPYGLDHHRSQHAAVSLCAPSEPFSRQAAMERNALIYQACEQAVVVHARFREGGTWIGATDALRRRLCPLLVREEQTPAHRALAALGARWLPEAGRLAECLATRGPQMSLAV